MLIEYIFYKIIKKKRTNYRHGYDDFSDFSKEYDEFSNWDKGIFWLVMLTYIFSVLSFITMTLFAVYLASKNNIGVKRILFILIALFHSLTYLIGYFFYHKLYLKI
jgi:hypothetical protein